MNPLIQRYFNRLEEKLYIASSVRECEILQRAVAKYSGYIRVRARLLDDGLLALSEYVKINPEGMLTVEKYRYHWQDAKNSVICRWDNAAHHPELPHAPHHVHLPDGSVEGVGVPPDVADVLKQIEAWFEQEQNG